VSSTGLAHRRQDSRPHQRRRIAVGSSRLFRACRFHVLGRCVVCSGTLFFAFVGLFCCCRAKILLGRGMTILLLLLLKNYDESKWSCYCKFPDVLKYNADSHASIICLNVYLLKS
jgi:hypothetical protein